MIDFLWTPQTIFATAYIAIAVVAITMLVVAEIKRERFVAVSKVFQWAMLSRTSRLALWFAWWWYGYHFFVEVIPR